MRSALCGGSCVWLADDTRRLAAFAATAIGGHRFLHQLDGLGHLLEIAGIETQILVDPIPQQAHGFCDLVGGLAQGGRINVERAAKDGAEIGGHPLSGHVDFMATIASLRQP